MVAGVGGYVVAEPVVEDLVWGLVLSRRGGMWRETRAATPGVIGTAV